jgi:histidinol-phosphate aminotransferase
MASRLSPRPEWIRSGVRAISPYTPGEQPKVKGLIKLNTNENPYPPAPQVLECIKQAVDGRLRLYPNPRAQRLREALARHHGVPADHVMVGNGSDELLALATRAFVEPLPVKGRVTEPAASTIQFWVPSYSLYPVLASIHGARLNPVALAPDYGIPSLATMRREGAWDFKAALSLVTTPNAPSGRGYATATLASLCRAQDGVVILDEAYADFASEHAIELVRKMPNVIISRTFSKSYSLCFQRIGYFIGHPALIQALDGIRDSYNVNGLGQVAAEATLKHGAYYRANFRRIIRLREQVSASLIAEGFEVLPSQTNFLFARPPGVAAKQWFEGLRKHKILVRWFASEGLSDRLRVTIGSESEMDAFLTAVRRLRRRLA